MLPGERLGGAADQALARRVDQHEAILGVEREERHVDLGHHAGQKRRGLDGLGALALERPPEIVDLVHHQAERRARPGGDASNRVVPFPQRAEKVGDQVERLVSIVVERRAVAPQVLQASIFDTVGAFTGGAFQDDATLIVIGIE